MQVQALELLFLSSALSMTLLWPPTSPALENGINEDWNPTTRHLQDSPHPPEAISAFADMHSNAEMSWPKNHSKLIFQ